VLTSVRVWRQGQIETWPAPELGLTYRSSRLKGAESNKVPTVILSATFRLTPDPEGRAAELAQAAIQHRRRTQPTEKSAGSIFKNPPGDYAGRLIDLAGLKGRCVGDACISEKHANFIINRGRARAADVVALMNLARREVWRQFHVLLEPEILFIGDWSQGPALIDPREE
jgi:UDP-N-acetylmuramate dehydrogenase